MPEEVEQFRLLQCSRFIRQIDDHLKFDNRILCTSIHIFCLYSRMKSFAEFDMFLACGVSHFIAAKMLNKHPNIEFYERFVHERQPESQRVKGKTNRRDEFEVVKAKLHSQALQIEIDILTVM